MIFKVLNTASKMAQVWKKFNNGVAILLMAGNVSVVLLLLGTYDERGRVEGQEGEPTATSSDGFRTCRVLWTKSSRAVAGAMGCRSRFQMVTPRSTPLGAELGAWSMGHHEGDKSRLHYRPVESYFSGKR